MEDKLETEKKIESEKRQGQVGHVGAPCRLSNVCVADQPNDGINQPVIESLWRT